MRRVIRFQSTPGRSTGRTCAPKGYCAGRVPVSIHARSLDRANRSAKGNIENALEFQSTPGRSTGRTLPSGLSSSPPRTFQSTPGRSTGRTQIVLPELAPIPSFQSTPGRSTGRTRCGEQSAIRSRVSIHARSLDRANAFASASTGCAPRVSIHARSLDRANVGHRGCSCGTHPVSIHARSLDRANPKSLRYIRDTVRRFNPRPVARPGEPRWRGWIGGVG